MQAGFWPDTFSTDWTPEGRTAQVIDFPNVMSKFLDFGMPLDQVIARATVNASRVFEVFRDRGTLNVGAPADVAVLELRARVVRVRRQLREQANRPPATLPERDRSRREARPTARLAGGCPFQEMTCVSGRRCSRFGVDCGEP